MRDNGEKGVQSLVGKWTGTLPDSSELMMNFTNDMTVEGSMKGSMDFEYVAKYSVDFSADPVTLDIFDFDNADFGDIRYLGIIKFTEKNKLMMRGNIDTQGNRPSNFDNDAFELKRE